MTTTGPTRLTELTVGMPVHESYEGAEWVTEPVLSPDARLNVSMLADLPLREIEAVLVTAMHRSARAHLAADVVDWDKPWGFTDLLSSELAAPDFHVKSKKQLEAIALTGAKAKPGGGRGRPPLDALKLIDVAVIAVRAHSNGASAYQALADEGTDGKGMSTSHAYRLIKRARAAGFVSDPGFAPGPNLPREAIERAATLDGGNA